jgi:hypothetical protein
MSVWIFKPALFSKEMPLHFRRFNNYAFHDNNTIVYLDFAVFGPLSFLPL